MNYPIQMTMGMVSMGSGLNQQQQWHGLGLRRDDAKLLIGGVVRREKHEKNEEKDENVSDKMRTVQQGAIQKKVKFNV